jgi:hypothetical protein
MPVEINTSASDGQRSRMKLLGWQPIGKGALIGRARVRLPSKLEIGDIGLFEKDGQRWAHLPSEPMRDGAGQVMKNQTGKVRYRSAIRWANRDLQEAFRGALIELVEAQHGPIGGRE